MQIIVGTDRDNQADIVAPARLGGSHQRQASGKTQADDGRRPARTLANKMRALADRLDGLGRDPIVSQVGQLGRDCQESVRRKRGGKGHQTRFLDAEMMNSVQHNHHGGVVVSDGIVEAGGERRGGGNRAQLGAHRIGADVGDLAAMLRTNQLSLAGLCNFQSSDAARRWCLRGA